MTGRYPRFAIPSWLCFAMPTRWLLEAIERCCATGDPRVREPGEPKTINNEVTTSPLHDRRTPADALPASREPLTYKADSETLLTKFLPSAANTSLLSTRPGGLGGRDVGFQVPLKSHSISPVSLRHRGLRPPLISSGSREHHERPIHATRPRRFAAALSAHQGSG